MTNRATLTTSYLDEVARRGATADDLLAAVRADDTLNALYRRQYLSRPLFLGHAESEQLNADLQHVRTALVSLPDLLYGGDLAAFGKAAGLTDLQAAAVLRTRAENATHWGRADLYSQPDGLRLLEFNMGSGAGGSDNGDIRQALLHHPVATRVRPRAPAGLPGHDARANQPDLLRMRIRAGVVPDDRPGGLA